MTKGRAGNGVGAGKAWSGRFQEPTHPLVEAFTGSVNVDRRMYAEDIQGSIAHCKSLEKARVLTPGETRTIVKALEAVKSELDRRRFKFAPQDEDIHMAIERRLTELIGPLGGKLHTGRSRNDQVALDVRLYLRQHLQEFAKRLQECQRVLVAKAKAHRTVAMPGYTHLQQAQPVLLSHHLLAYVSMFERDKGRVRSELLKRLQAYDAREQEVREAYNTALRTYDAELKRAGLDYWDEAKLTIHENPSEFLDWLGSREPWLATKNGGLRYDRADYENGDVLVFGSETGGLPQEWLDRWRLRSIYVPILGKVRSYNLANTVSVILAHASLRAGIYDRKTKE